MNQRVGAAHIGQRIFTTAVHAYSYAVTATFWGILWIARQHANLHNFREVIRDALAKL